MSIMTIVSNHPTFVITVVIGFCTRLTVHVSCLLAMTYVFTEVEQSS